MTFQMALMFQHPLFLLPLMAFLLILALIGQCLTSIWKFRYLLILLFLFSFLLWSIFYRGADGSYVFFSREGLLYGAGMGLRLSGMVIAGIIFLSTTKVEAFSYGLNLMGIPFRVSFTLTLAFRLVPLFIDNAFTIVQAQKSRGLEIEGVNIIRKIKGTLPLIIPVFASSLRSADHLALALESKGFGLKSKRTSFFWFHFGQKDVLALLLFLILDAVIVLMRWKGYGSVI
jgi:energy-coupling factor transport system permease protein